jgi:uncharacterized protein YwgA
MGDYEEMYLARIIDAAGGIDGRVKMQKIVYLLTLMGYRVPYNDFTIRQQGPFSRAVAVAADTLKGGEVLDETESSLGNDQQGKQVVQYGYRVREALAPLIRQHFDVAAPPGKPSVDEVARYLKAKDRAVLEVAATRLYLEKEDKLSGEALEKELRRLKGHLRNAFPEAERLLDELKRRTWL